MNLTQVNAKHTLARCFSIGIATVFVNDVQSVLAVFVAELHYTKNRDSAGRQFSISP